MARVFITGSSDGLGLMAARLLIGEGHDVVLHGRNDRRSRDALAAAAGAEGAVISEPHPPNNAAFTSPELSGTSRPIRATVNQRRQCTRSAERLFRKPRRGEM